MTARRDLLIGLPLCGAVGHVGANAAAGRHVVNDRVRTLPAPRTLRIPARNAA